MMDCPSGGTKCGGLLRMDVEYHLEEECRYAGATRGQAAMANRERVTETAYALMGTLVIAGLLMVVLEAVGTFRTITPVRTAAFVLVGIPSFAVLGVKWYENRMVEAEMADKMD